MGQIEGKEGRNIFLRFFCHFAKGMELQFFFAFFHTFPGNWLFLQNINVCAVSLFTQGHAAYSTEATCIEQE